MTLLSPAHLQLLQAADAATEPAPPEHQPPSKKNKVRFQDPPTAADLEPAPIFQQKLKKAPKKRPRKVVTCTKKSSAPKPVVAAAVDGARPKRNIRVRGTPVKPGKQKERKKLPDEIPETPWKPEDSGKKPVGRSKSPRGKSPRRTIKMRGFD